MPIFSNLTFSNLTISNLNYNFTNLTNVGIVSIFTGTGNLRLSPLKYSPVYNEVISVWNSPNKVRDNFEFRFHLSGDSAFRTGSFATVKKVPNIEGFGVLDSHRVLENFVTYDIESFATGITKNPKSIVEYKIEQSEEYSSTNRITRILTTYATSTTGAKLMVGLKFGASTLKAGDKITISNLEAGVDVGLEGTHTIQTKISSTIFILTTASIGVEPYLSSGYATMAATGGKVASNVVSTFNKGYAISSAQPYGLHTDGTMSQDKYVNYTAADASFLTNKPFNVSVKHTDWAWLNFINDDEAPVVSVFISGNTGGHIIPNPYSGVTATDDRTLRHLRVGVGPAALNNTQRATSYGDAFRYDDISSGGGVKLVLVNTGGTSSTVGKNYFQDGKCYVLRDDNGHILPEMNNEVGIAEIGSNYVIITGSTFTVPSAGKSGWLFAKNPNDMISPLGIVGPDTTEYTVQAIATEVQSGRTAPTQFTLDIGSCKYENIRLIFQDGMGSFVGLNFDRVSKTTIKTKRETYRKNFGKYDGDTNTWGYNKIDRGFTTLDNVFTESVRCISNWVEDGESEYFLSLYKSPEVYHQLEDGTLLPVTVKTDTVVEVESINGIGNYKLTFEYANRDNIQRG